MSVIFEHNSGGDAGTARSARDRRSPRPRVSVTRELSFRSWARNCYWRSSIGRSGQGQRYLSEGSLARIALTGEDGVPQLEVDRQEAALLAS
jgi:hypothetical protein